MRASCHCGQLRVTVPGPTKAVVACHCKDCQKRSGALFGVAAYYPHGEIEIEGAAKRFSRPTAAGGVFEQRFCTECGVTVLMKGAKNPDVTGIPIGLFDDAHDMQAVRSVWEDRKHAWVEITSAVQHFLRARVD